MKRKIFRSGCMLIIITLILLNVIGEATQVAYAATPIRIAAVGDSITWGLGTSNAATASYPVQLQTMLGTTHYTVENYGHIGATMLKLGDLPYWNTQEFTDSSTFLPDIVVIMLGTNDSKAWNWQYKNAYISNYEAMIAHYRSLSSHPIVYINLPPPAFNNAAGINGAVIQNQLIPMIRKVSTNTGAPIIDVNTPLLDASSIFPDGIHPNDQGAYQISSLVHSRLTHQIFTKTIHSAAAQDGWVLESSENSSIGGSVNNTAQAFNVGDNTSKKQYRGILSFNTSSLLDAVVIKSVTLKIKKHGIIGGGSPLTTFQGFIVAMKKGFFGSASALEIGDFQSVASRNFGPFSPSLSNNFYTINLTNGKAYINKLTGNDGLTQIRLRFNFDDNNDGVANYLSLYSGDAAAADRPQLVITYHMP